MEEKSPRSKLQNSLVELCVVVGVDEDTGLEPSRGAAAAAASGATNWQLETGSYQSFLVGAVWGEGASFPHTETAISFDGFSAYEEGSIVVASPIKGSPAPKSATRKKRTGICASKSPMLPISAEEINGLPPFCLPDECKVYKKKPSPHCHTFVMTDVLGVHKFAVCLTYYREFYAFPVEGESDGHFFLLPDGTASRVCYAPTCLCLISNYAYYGVLKDCLSSLVCLLPNGSPELRNLLLRSVPRLAYIPVPLPGTIPLAFSFSGHKCVLRPSLLNRPVCDIDLYHPFVIFSVDDIFKIITSILTEQRLVFLSSNYALLTPIMESFFSYILPFVWRPTYVPVLPSMMTELLAAPGTFAMGCCHSPSAQEALADCEGLVVIDLDSGSLSVCPTLNLPEIPDFAASLFKERFRKVPKPFDLQHFRPRTVDLEEERQARENHKNVVNSFIRSAFVEMLAVLFQRVNKFCIFGQKPQFRKEQFLQSWKNLKPFYSMVCATDMFGIFCHERLHRKLDFYDEEREKLSKSNRSVDMTDSPCSSPAMPVRGQMAWKKNSKRIYGDSDDQISLSELLSSKSLSLESEGELAGNSVFELPEYDQIDGSHAYDTCFGKASEILESESSSLRAKAGCRYIRGMVHLAYGRSKDALEEFYAIAKESSQVYPKKLVEHIQGNTEGRARATYVYLDRIPRKAMHELEFEQYVRGRKIMSEDEAISQLWRCLTSSAVLSSQSLRSFLEVWSEVRKFGESLAFPPELELQDADEDVLLVSPLVRDSRGQGRLILSHRRLLALHGSVYSQISFLHEIASLENITSPFLFSLGQEGMKVTFSDPNKSPYVVCLKESTNAWIEYINEMKAALSFADCYRDPNVIVSAGNNIMAAHAVSQCHQEPNFLASLRLNSAAESKLGSPSSLLLFRFRNATLPGNTYNALERRLYPSGESETIECLLFTKPNDSGSGKLWCGVGSSGSLFVCDVSTWTFDLPINVATKRIYCLVEYKSEVWVGSLDNNLYVVDVNSGQTVSTLSNHKDALSGITLVENNGQAEIWTSSFDGVLICWNPKTRDVLRRIEVPKARKLASPISHGNFLWCSDRKKILAIDISRPDHHEVKSFAIDYPPEKPLSVDCLVKTPNGQIWCGWSGHEVSKLSMWSADTQTCRLVREYKHCRGFSCMVVNHRELWIGTKDGQLMIIDWETFADKQTLEEAHTAGIRSLCTIEGGRVASGSTSKDGYIAIWKKTIQ